LEELKMMKNPEETIGNLIDKQGVSLISSVDENGYPNTKAMLPPVKREGIKTFYWHTNSPCASTSDEPARGFRDIPFGTRHPRNVQMNMNYNFF
jgi:hypothetical protein